MEDDGDSHDPFNAHSKQKYSRKDGRHWTDATAERSSDESCEDRRTGYESTQNSFLTQQVPSFLNRSRFGSGEKPEPDSGSVRQNIDERDSLDAAINSILM